MGWALVFLAMFLFLAAWLDAFAGAGLAALTVLGFGLLLGSRETRRLGKLKES